MRPCSAVPVDRVWVAGAELEGGSGLGGVAEPVQRRSAPGCRLRRRPGAVRRRPRRRGAAGRRRAAGRPRPASRRAATSWSSAKVPAIPASSTRTTSPGPSLNMRAPPGTDAPDVEPGGERAGGPLVEELVQVLRADPELPSEHVGGGRRGGERDEVTAALPENVREGAHRGRLPRPGRADAGEQQPGVGRERGHQVPLASVQRCASPGLEPVEHCGHRRARTGPPRSGSWLPRRAGFRRQEPLDRCSERRRAR